MQRMIVVIILLISSACAQDTSRFYMYGDVIVTLDRPVHYSSSKKTNIILYALPNGNTTLQTMGKNLQPGDDWHFDIQHIRAQTAFVRKEIKNENFVVAYLENSYLSWPSWKSKHGAYKEEVLHIADTIFSLFTAQEKKLHLSGHSGGGRFAFSFLDASEKIPSNVDRITFLDSDYGYDASYTEKLVSWLGSNKSAMLNVFAYNDSVALLNGKRFVSDTGGTWYRSRMMLTDLSRYFSFKKIRDDSLIVYVSADKRIRFYLKTNPDKKIFHTIQVERNGFIHSILAGTRRESKKYSYFGERAYTDLIGL